MTSSVALAALAATVYAGNPLVLTATLAPAAATGTVVFRDATLGVLGQSSVVKGAAILTLASPSLGAYSITASYSGDLDDTPATSPVATTQVTLTPTTTALTVSPNPAPFGSSVTFSASLSPASASGSVVFMDGATTLGTALLVAGKASLASSTFAVGTHSLRAVYSGDTLNAASTSASFGENVTASTTSTSLTLAQSSVIANSIATVNIRVSSTNTTPSGTVTLRSEATTLATGPVANAASGAGYATLSFNTATLGLEIFPLVASYSGDTNDLPSDSSATPVAIVVNAIPTTASLGLSPAQIVVQGSTTLNASVASAAGTPTGSITFTSNGTNLGTVTLNSAGTASFTLTANSLGSFPIAAAYVPTGLFAATIAALQTLVVTAPLSAALSPATIHAAPGGSGTSTLLLTPLSGFMGAIQTACATSAPFVQCSVTAPATIGSGPLSVPVQITVSKTTVGLSQSAGAGFALLLPGLITLCSRRRFSRQLHMLGGLIVLAAASFVIIGCASGGTFFSVPSGAQTVTVTLTAAGTSVAATLTVNIAD